ncbi:D-inositol-3-phosphate glycosyltransferase [compost metagenome]
MKSLPSTPSDSVLPRLSIFTEQKCSRDELERIAVFLAGQTLRNWEWLQGPRRDFQQSIDMGEAVLVLPYPPKAMRPTALEEAIWFLRSRPELAWVELVDGMAGDKLFAPRNSLPEGRIGLTFNHLCRGESAFPEPMSSGSKRLLLLVPWLEPGGADRCNLDILRYFSRQGWELTVVASLAAEHRWLASFRAITRDVWVLPHFLVARRALDFLGYLLKSRKPDLVLLSNSSFAHDALPFIRACCPLTPLIDLNHMEESWGTGGHPGRSVSSTSQLDRHWVVSRHLRRWMMARGVDGGKVDVLHWFADIARWRPCASRRDEVRQHLGLNPDTVLIVYAGRLCRQKRPEVFAATMRDVVRKHRDVTALVLGDGELAAPLRRELQRMGLTHQVRMLGWQDEEGMRKLLQAADIFFLPSAGEGIALVLYEAMACGLAIVAADVGGQAELVSPECGFLIPRQDPRQEVRDYTRRIGQLINDPERLERMRQNAATRVRAQFSKAGFESRLANLLEGVSVVQSESAPALAGTYQEGISRLAMQWSAYRMINRIRRLTRLEASRSLLRFVELCVKGVFWVRTSGVRALWRRPGSRG